MTASDTNRTLCSDHLKGPSIWGVMGAGSEINPTLHIALQLSYIYILDEQSQTDLVWSSIGETAAHYHSTATSTTQQSTAQRRPVIYDWQGHDHSAHQPEHRPAEATSKTAADFRVFSEDLEWLAANYIALREYSSGSITEHR